MGLREDATALGATAAAGALVGLSVFYNSPLFGVLFGVVLGALVTDFIQSRTWKRTVKRDFALDNIKAIYSPLYRELGLILNEANGFSFRTGYTVIHRVEWARISSEHYYQFIPGELRKQLDGFYGHVSDFRDRLQVVNRVVKEIIVDEASKFYGFPIESIAYVIRGEGIAFNSTQMVNPLLFGIHPKSLLSVDYPERTDLKFSVVYDGKKGGQSYSNELREPKDLERFDQLFRQLSDEVNKNEDVMGLKKTLEMIVKTGPRVRELVLQKIKEPLPL